MNKFSFMCNSLLVTALLLGMGSLANAKGYRIQEITKTEVADITFAISGGNQNLNNKGQIIGISRKYTKDKIYNFGDRAFLWDARGMRELGNFGTDTNNYAVSTPVAINDQGQVAGRSAYFINGIDHGSRACLWDKGKVSNLSVKNDEFVNSEAIGINGNGWVLGTGLFYDHGIDKGSHVLLWRNGKTQDIYSLEPYASIKAFNDNNQVVGFHDVLDEQGNYLGQHAFLLAGGALNDLGTLGSNPTGLEFSTPIDINNNSVIISSDYWDSDFNPLDTHHGFIWIDGKLSDLGALGINAGGLGSTYPVAINNNNQVIGSSSIFDEQGKWLGDHGFLWADGTMRDLGALGVDESGLSFSTPYALNAKGQVVGFSTYSENGIAKGYRAFLYQNNTMIDINSLLPAGSGLLLENALAINDKGQIIAFGTRTKGKDTYQVYVLLTP